MSIDKVQTLLQEKADLQARLNLLPYEGTVEVKSNKEKKYPGKTEIIRISHIDEIREHTASTNIFDR